MWDYKSMQYEKVSMLYLERLLISRHLRLHCLSGIFPADSNYLFLLTAKHFHMHSLFQHNLSFALNVTQTKSNSHIKNG